MSTYPCKSTPSPLSTYPCQSTPSPVSFYECIWTPTQVSISKYTSAPTHIPVSKGTGCPVNRLMTSSCLYAFLEFQSHSTGTQAICITLNDVLSNIMSCQVRYIHFQISQESCPSNMGVSTSPCPVGKGVHGVLPCCSIRSPRSLAPLIWE